MRLVSFGARPRIIRSMPAMAPFLHDYRTVLTWHKRNSYVAIISDSEKMCNFAITIAK